MIAETSQFWKDVNGDIDERVDFDHLDNNYKVKQTKVLRKTEKKKDTVSLSQIKMKKVHRSSSLKILSKDRLTIIGVFLKKYKFTDVDLFLKPLIDPNSNQDIDFFKIFLTKLPKTDEVKLFSYFIKTFRFVSMHLDCFASKRFT